MESKAVVVDNCLIFWSYSKFCANAKASEKSKGYKAVKSVCPWDFDFSDSSHVHFVVESLSVPFLP